MSVSCYFFVEVQDANGKWHLAKWYTDERFEEFDNTGATYSFESETNINGVKHIVKREKWTGLQLRDELSWTRSWGGDSAVDGLPDDISDELAELVKNYNEILTASRREIYVDENYVHNFAKQCSYISLSDLWGICDKRQEQWKKGLLERIRDIQLEEISNKLDDLKKLIQGKEVKEEKKKKDDEEFYEDTIEYYLNEQIDDVIQLRMEVGALSEIAENFTGDRWIAPEKVRVIFYFD